MPRGRPPKPLEEKRRLGNPGKRSLPKATLPIAPLDCEFERLTPSDAMEQVLRDGRTWLGATDTPMLTLLWEAIEDYERLREARASFRDQRAARAEIAGFLSVLGFDPTARARLGLAEVKPASALQSLVAQRTSEPRA